MKDIEILINGVLNSDKRVIAKTLTKVENETSDSEELLENCISTLERHIE